jgi:hypothetical protein
MVRPVEDLEQGYPADRGGAIALTLVATGAAAPQRAGKYQVAGLQKALARVPRPGAYGEYVKTCWQFCAGCIARAFFQV